MFTERFKEILQMYWINQKADLNIIVHERLKNSTDSLQHVINLFLYQDELFSTGIPTSANLGLMKLDSKKSRAQLTPSSRIWYKSLNKSFPPQSRKDSKKQTGGLQTELVNLANQQALLMSLSSRAQTWAIQSSISKKSETE